MKKFRIDVAVLVILCCISMSFAQQYNLTGSGARAEGFGGAFIGVADDATAVVWNPAGLSQLQRPEASVVARVVGEKWTSSDLTGANSFNNWSANQNHFLLNFGSLAIPFKLGQTNCVIAAAYQRQLDWYDTWNQPDDEYTTKGGADTFTPGLGVQVMPILSFGFSANIWFGKSTHDETYTSSTSSTGQRQWNYNGTYSGTNFVVGGMLDLNGLKRPVPLKIGVSVKTPFNLNADYNYEYIPAVTGFSFGSLSTYSTHGTIAMPLMLGFGASYQIGENLTVAADFETRAFGNKDVTISYNAPYDQYFDPSTSPMSESKKNLNQVRFGAEYLIVSNIGVFPLRAGYQNVPTLTAYKDVNGDPTNQVIGSAFAFGTGYISGSFALDLAYSIASFEYQQQNAWNQKYSKSTLSTSLIVYF